MHVPGNSYTRRNPAFKNLDGTYAFEVMEADSVKARVEFTHENGEPRVWLTGGSLTPDQALRLCETITGMITQPPADWQPAALAEAMPEPNAAQRAAFRRIGQATRKTAERLDQDMLDLIVDSAVAQCRMQSDGSAEWTPDRGGMPGHIIYTISPSGEIDTDRMAS